MIKESERIKIKEALIKKNLNQKDIAKKFNVTSQFINNILNGRCNNSTIEKFLLEDILNDTRTKTN